MYVNINICAICGNSLKDDYLFASKRCASDLCHAVHRYNFNYASNVGKFKYRNHLIMIYPSQDFTSILVDFYSVINYKKIDFPKILNPSVENIDDFINRAEKLSAFN